MISVAEVFRQFADGYLSAHGVGMPTSHRRAIADILSCHTEALGGHVWHCNDCGHEVFSYHSCKNRSCPQCHAGQTEKWIECRKAEMLPTHYFHVVVTVPEQLRALLRANQRDGYGLLMRATTDAIIELARDPRYIGGTVGVMAVLHTWTQLLIHHPHVHCLVTGGGVSADGRNWCSASKNFLFPSAALSKLVRGKLKALLAHKCPDLIAPPAAWTTPWVTKIIPWGNNADAVLRYLARYVFRIAITSTRIVALDRDTVTISSRDRKSGARKTCRIGGHEFLRRFLQHVLPKGFHKVRYCGLWHPANHNRLAQAQLLLALEQPDPPPPTPPDARGPATANLKADNPPPRRLCPHCGGGHLIYIRRVTRQSALGP
jgi:Putative transposase/Transposase zinc-binding domain